MTDTSDRYKASIALGAKHRRCMAPSSKRQWICPCRGLCLMYFPLPFQQLSSAKPQIC